MNSNNISENTLLHVRTQVEGDASLKELKYFEVTLNSFNYWNLDWSAQINSSESRNRIS